MTNYKEITPKKTFMGRLGYGCDLLDDLNGICSKLRIRLGRIEAIGAVQKAKIGYYDQKARSYHFLDLDVPMEILKLSGNVSIKDGEPFVHAHITLADKSGNSFGGHLAPGTIVFACEVIVQAFDGPEFKRYYDEETGLPLWELDL